jgi:hypothetical protein
MPRLVMAAVFSGLWAMTSLAQAPPPAPPPAPSPPAAAKSAPKGKAATAPQSAEGIECSKQADAKGLHGPERVRFRANCKKKLMKEKT